MLRIGISILFVTLCSLHLTNSGPTQKLEDTIKFPGPINDDTSNRYGTDDAPDDVPMECRNQNFCTVKPPNYPQEKFNKMFAKQTPQPLLVIDSIADRQGDPNDMDNCDSTVTYEPLYRVRSKRGWHTVIQAPEQNYVQMVRLETCRNVGGECFTVFPSLPDISTSCVQKYSIWEFLVASDNGTERIQSELPVCCSCHYKTNSK